MNTVTPRQKHGHASTNVLFILMAVFVVALAVQVIAALRTESHPAEALTVESVHSRSAYLLSDVRRRTDSESTHTQAFRILNTSSDELRVRIESVSCGCLGFSVNGDRIDRTADLSIPGREAVTLGAIVPLRASIGSYSMQFEIVARQRQTDAVVYRRKLVVRMSILPDVVCFPPSVRLVKSQGKGEELVGAVRVEHLTYAGNSTVRPIGRFDSQSHESNDTLSMVVATAPSGIETIEGGLIRSTHLVTVVHHGEPTEPDIPGVPISILRLRFPAYGTLPTVEQTVPILVSDTEVQE